MKPQTPSLTVYSTMAIGFLAVSKESEAQISYHDFDPDNEFPVAWFLDVNIDGYYDFEIWSLNDEFMGSCSYCYTGGLISFYINPVGSNQIGFESVLTLIDNCFSDGWYYRPIIQSVPEGDLIGPDMNFTSEKAWIFKKFDDPDCGSSTFGDSPLNTPTYYGFRIVEDGAYQYGWIRLSATGGWDSEYNGKIHDWAYNTVPEAPIAAGDTFDLVTCEQPTITSVIHGTNAFKLFWDPVEFASGYRLYYRELGAFVWTKLNLGPVTHKKVNGLLCNTTYEYKLKAVCEDDSITIGSDFTLINTVTTGICRMGEDELSNDAIEIWSNSNQIFIYIEDQISDAVQFTLTTLTGQVVLRSELINNETIINTELPTGIYIATISFKGSGFNRKLHIE